ncbi:hypothetical protein B7P43_G09002, partial [Cryptotermes secundus]
IPFCKIPFQPSEDTDALLSELPSLSQNVVHAADPSQIRNDGRRVWKNFPPQLCNCLRCEASGVGPSVVMQDDDVSSRTFIAQCTMQSSMLVFPSLKCFTHFRTLLAPMHTLP